jgi:hypothetical protein
VAAPPTKSGAIGVSRPDHRPQSSRLCYHTPHVRNQGPDLKRTEPDGGRPRIRDVFPSDSADFCRRASSEVVDKRHGAYATNGTMARHRRSDHQDRSVVDPEEDLDLGSAGHAHTKYSNVRSTHSNHRIPISLGSFVHLTNPTSLGPGSN